MENNNGKSSFHTSYLLIIVYMIVNIIVITLGLIQIENSIGFIPPDFVYIGQGVLFFLILLVIHLSPVGEAYSRKKTKCRAIKDQQLKSKIDEIYKEAYAKAKEINPNLPDGIELFVNDEKSPNALAVGRKTICMTSGLMKRPKEEIVAVLTHELAHISNKDTTVKALIEGGNSGVRALLFLWKIVLMVLFTPLIFVLCILMPSKGDQKPKPTQYITIRTRGRHYEATSRIGYELIDVSDAVGNRAFAGGLGIVIKFLGFIRDLLYSVPAMIWSAITVLLTRPSSRDMEYEADVFTFNAGLGDGLCSFLHYIQVTYFNKNQGLIDKISSTHPSPENRVSRLQQMGAKY